MKADYHPHQSKRLKALRSYEILDTPRESEFDEIVELAAKICRAPISVINLIDNDRQWFKAEVGLGVRETPLETSICSHVILSDEFVMIEDTHLDKRTADNPLCNPIDGLRFYAGALLKSEDGLPIGTLCVLDTKPRTLDDDQRFAVEVLSRRVMRELDLRKALKRYSILQDETDHRIKNSLSSVSSAVRLYERQVEQGGDIAASFRAIRRHIDSTAAVHEAIYRSADQDVDLEVYMSALIPNIRRSMPERVSITTTVEPVLVAPNMASTVGLIVNEFASNTLKHGREGEIQIVYRLTLKESSLLLECQNDAPSTNDEMSASSEGIGARLMRASANQFGGSIVEISDDSKFTLAATLPVGC